MLLNDFDILCLSETWLSTDVSNDECFSRQYVWRYDRSIAGTGNVLNGPRGGGVVVAVRDSIVS